ncbi:MAG: hypothetical protein ACE5H3_03995 [Planctomycetota bacterium]
MLPALLLSCAPALLLGTGAAAGAWGYDEHTKDGGEIVLSSSPEKVYEAAIAVARQRGYDVMTSDGAMRVECEVDDADVVFQIFVIPENDDVARLRVTAKELLVGREELAKDLGLQVQNRLG